MNKLLIEVDAWVTAMVFAALMLAGWGVGWRAGRRLAQKGQEAPSSKSGDAVLALLGLLLAFTFSMSLGKHDQRRQMVVNDSNAIGDFYTCASLVNEPVRSQLQGLIRDYVRHRIEVANGRPDPAAFQQGLAEAQQMQNRMQALVGEAVAAGTPLAVPLVNTLNEVTSSHAARLAAAHDRLPASIVLLLFVTAVVAMAELGRQQGTSGRWELTTTVGFVALVSLVVWVTLDLNEPQRGWITVSQEPLQRLLAGMTP
jgi:hypothetical protein